MNPTTLNILSAINSGNLAAVLRGDMFAFVTPVEINGDMRPTDHDQLLIKGIYPAAAVLGTDLLQDLLAGALETICVDARGVFCAFQLFYMQVFNERDSTSPLNIDKVSLPHRMALCFMREEKALCSLEFNEGDSLIKRPYKLTWSRMNTLTSEYGIDWGMPVPPLLPV